MDTQEDEFDIQEAIQLHVISEGEGQCGWVHTHGMAALGCAELEIRGVPLFLIDQAAQLLNKVAQYIVDRHRSGGPPVMLGQTMSTGEMSLFKFVKLDPISGEEDHYESERWALSDEPMRATCERCCEGCESCGGESLN